MQIECKEGLASGYPATVERSTVDGSVRWERIFCEQMWQSEPLRKREEQICSAISRTTTDRGEARRILLREIFYDLSSGQKIVLSIAAHLAAYLQKRSLVIFDEPEAHLHPPLLAAVLKSLRIALDIQDSYCILATHSPVALQETPARFVQVLRRFGESRSVVKPVSETFGENIGILTRDAFDLNSSETDYHGVLEGLAADLTIDEIENLFGYRLGFQARSYIISIQKQKSESDS
jgi:hypothetical protein